MNNEKNYYKPAYHVKNPEHHQMIVDIALGKKHNRSFWSIQKMKTKMALNMLFKTTVVSMCIATSVFCCTYLMVGVLNNKSYLDLLNKFPGVFFGGLFLGFVLGMFVFCVRRVILDIQDILVIYSIHKQAKKTDL